MEEMKTVEGEELGNSPVMGVSGVKKNGQKWGQIWLIWSVRL